MYLIHLLSFKKMNDTIFLNSDFEWAVLQGYFVFLAIVHLLWRLGPFVARDKSTFHAYLESQDVGIGNFESLKHLKSLTLNLHTHFTSTAARTCLYNVHILGIWNFE